MHQISRDLMVMSAMAVTLLLPPLAMADSQYSNMSGWGITPIDPRQGGGWYTGLTLGGEPSMADMQLPYGQFGFINTSPGAFGGVAGYSSVERPLIQEYPSALAGVRVRQRVAVKRGLGCAQY